MYYPYNISASEKLELDLLFLQRQCWTKSAFSKLDVFVVHNDLVLRKPVRSDKESV